MSCAIIRTHYSTRDGAALALSNYPYWQDWRDRLRDFTAVFSAPFDAEGFRVHETMGTRDGALIGAIFGDDVPEEYADAMREKAGEVCEALAMAGARARKFDCSSFAQHVYASSQTSLPRTTLQQYEVGRRVAASDLQAGDLVFFAFSRRPVDHVGIYTGRGSFVHVSSSTRTVRLETLSKAVFAESVVGGRRVLGP